MTTCRRCRGPMTTQEEAAYRGRCENCYSTNQVEDRRDDPTIVDSQHYLDKMTARVRARRAKPT